MRSRRAHAAVLVAAIAAFGSAVLLQTVRDRSYPRDSLETRRMLYVRSGPAMQRIALSFDALAADVYWIRAIQHYGGDRLARGAAGRNYQLLYPLLDLTTSLDPYFVIAYRFGAIFLAEPYPGGPGRPDQAVALLRKGMAAQPTKWQYYYDTAFVYYFHVHDYVAAAHWFRRGAEQPNAPNWLMPMAAAMLSRGDDRLTARFLWRQMLQSEQEWLRRTAQRSLLQLDALDRIDQIETKIRMSPLEGGQYSWQELVRRRILPGIPIDPTSTPFDIDAATGRVTVSRDSPLFPMPDTQRRPRQ